MVGSVSPLPIFYSFNHTTPAIHYVPLRAVLWTMKKRLTGVWFNDPWLISGASKGLLTAYADATWPTRTHSIIERLLS